MPIRFKMILLVVLALILAAPAAFGANNDPADVAAIRQVVEQFRTSIIDKDPATFKSLFFSDKPEEVTWQFVVDDARLAHLQKTRPESMKARHVPQSNYASFIDWVAAGSGRSEEVFSDVAIDTDGEVASVNFDYSFLRDAEQTNWGREMWQLIRTEQGWKIISVIWSIHDPISDGSSETDSNGQ